MWRSNYRRQPEAKTVADIYWSKRTTISARLCTIYLRIFFRPVCLRLPRTHDIDDLCELEKDSICRCTRGCICGVSVVLIPGNTYLVISLSAIKNLLINRMLVCSRHVRKLPPIRPASHQIRQPPEIARLQLILCREEGSYRAVNVIVTSLWRREGGGGESPRVMIWPQVSLSEFKWKSRYICGLFVCVQYSSPWLYSRRRRKSKKASQK